MFFPDWSIPPEPLGCNMKQNTSVRIRRTQRSAQNAYELADTVNTEKVPVTRQINGKDLSQDRNLTAADIGLGNVTNDAQAIAPVTNTDSNFPQWNGANSKKLKDGYSLTALISAVKQSMYRVGDIIMSASSTNPAAEYGGIWALWGAGKVPVCVDTGDTTDHNFDSVEKTGGEKKHQLTQTELPNVKFPVRTYSGYNLNTESGSDSTCLRVPYSALTAASVNTAGQYVAVSGGGDVAHNNLQPYITCYMWKKTA